MNRFKCPACGRYQYTSMEEKTALWGMETLLPGMSGKRGRGR